MNICFHYLLCRQSWGILHYSWQIYLMELLEEVEVVGDTCKAGRASHCVIFSRIEVGTC